MSANTVPDKYEKLGTPQGDNSDTLSSTPIGSAAIPPATERLVYYPMGGGQPAPTS